MGAERVEIDTGDGYVAVTPRFPNIEIEVGYHGEALVAVELARDEAERFANLIRAATPASTGKESDG